MKRIASVFIVVTLMSCGGETTRFNGGSEGYEVSEDESQTTDEPQPSPTIQGVVSEDLNPDTTPPSGAKRSGHFTVWATPQDPAPMQAYYIVIHVDLPPNVNNYSRSDISGSVAGTDSYRKSLAAIAKDEFEEETFEYRNQKARLIFWIPGGTNNIVDTIHVRSQLLAEQCTFTLTF